MTGPTSATTESRLPSGTLTFLLTDIEGSTTLWERQPAAMQSALARHDAILREGIERCGGRVFKTAGDAFYAAFEEASAAVTAALSVQCALGAEAWPTARPLRVRMALHTGEAQWRQGDYFGPALNVAARLLSVCRGGQMLSSATIGAGFDVATIPGARLERHGHYRLKGVEAPVEVCEWGIQGRAAFTPPEDTAHVYRVMRTGDSWQPVRAIRNNLPAERDVFIGRTRDLDALAERLDAGERFVTIVGPGGAGKTRFVRHYGRAWLGDWPGGVCFCDLSEARSRDGISSAVAAALDIPLADVDAVARIGHAIAGRGHCLIVLDNFEHLTVHAAATLGQWLDRAGEATFVVTSRERLRLPGEGIFVLDPLPLTTDAVDLFVARAKARQPGFALTPANGEAVARIVALLDGLPLAIELAAARVGVLTPTQIVERMRDRFALLAGANGASARQATLRAAIDWSWDLLAAWEQATLAQCAVFEGGFTLAQAENVVDVTGWTDAPPAIDAIQSLLDKSLLRTWMPAGGARYDLDEIYFGMYVSIHEYAAEKLGLMGADAARSTEERHGRCFAAFGSDAAVEALYARDGSLRRRALALELDNIVTACRRAIARDDGETAVMTYRAAWEVLDLRGPFAVAVALGTQVLGIPNLDDALRARASLVGARTLQRAGESVQALQLIQQTLALAQRLGDRRLEAGARANLGMLLRRHGRMEDARAELEAALGQQRELRNRRAEGSILNQLGGLHVDRGEVERGRRCYDLALALQREIGNRIDEASVLSQIAVLMGESGRLTEARAHFEQSLAISEELGDRVAEGEALNNLGCLHHDLGRTDEARSLYERALAMHREVGNRRFEGYALGDLGRLHLELQRWPEAQACLEQALAITRETADRRIEGSELRSLGELFLAQGQAGEARAAFAQAETVLREVGDKHYLALALCGRGELDRRAGDPGAGRAALAEAEMLAAETRAEPTSELRRRIAALEAALA